MGAPPLGRDGLRPASSPVGRDGTPACREVAPTEARGGAGLAALSMDTLAEAQARRSSDLLEPLLVAYAAWIEDQARLAEVTSGSHSKGE